MACKQKITVEALCKAAADKDEEVQGCKTDGGDGDDGKDKPELCCKAATADCLSCAKKMSVEEFCKASAERVAKGDLKIKGCEDYYKEDPDPEVCCEAMNAECMACAQKTTVEEICKKAAARVGAGDRMLAGCENSDEEETCESCVADGRSWQVGKCNETADCVVMDVGCATTEELCQELDKAEPEKEDFCAKGCEAYFDGCNMCKCMPGKLGAACTRKACTAEMKKPAMCLDKATKEDMMEMCTGAALADKAMQDICDKARETEDVDEVSESAKLALYCSNACSANEGCVSWDVNVKTLTCRLFASVTRVDVNTAVANADFIRSCAKEGQPQPGAAPAPAAGGAGKRKGGKGKGGKGQGGGQAGGKKKKGKNQG